MINNSTNMPLGNEGPIEDIPLAMCSTDDKGRIRRCNTMFSTLIGYSEEKLLSMSLLDITDSNLEKFFRRSLPLLQPNAPASVRTWFSRQDASTFPAILSLAAFRTESLGVLVNVAVIDDTYNHLEREKAKKENEESRRKEELKNEFIAIASHELRTPIQPILGFALLAKKGKVSQEQAWEGVLKEARRLQQLANDILDASRIESKTIIYRIETIRLNELLKTVIESHKNELKKELTIALNTEQPEIEIDADRSRLTQVINNLIGNAVKFTPSGSVLVSSRIIPERSLVEISIADNGPGIPADIFPKLFGKFVTKSHGEALTNEGTGLGLFISKAIIDGHRGEISARNNESGIGATFTMRLPIKQEA